MRTDKRLGEFDRAHVIATYFGFSPVPPPKITREDAELAGSFIEHPLYDPAEKIAVLRRYIEQNVVAEEHPLAWVYRNPVSRKKFGTHGLHFIGAPSAIAEAALIRTAFSILTEEGYKNLRVDINCIGDKDSIGAYERELCNYAKQFLTDLPENLRLKIKEDPFNLFHINAPELDGLREEAPSSINFLSSQSRAYFKEVLEYIEALGIEFRLAPELVGEKKHSSHTVFAIREPSAEGPGETLAIGYRYSRLSKVLGMKREIPVAGASILSTPKRESAHKIYKDLPRPKFFLVQLGREAKVKTLSLLELLRSHRIPVYHLIGRDKLTSQLAGAESSRASHIIIIGQKEAIDGTATVRNVSTRAQDTVPVSALPHFLKNLSI